MKKGPIISDIRSRSIRSSIKLELSKFPYGSPNEINGRKFWYSRTINTSFNLITNLYGQTDEPVLGIQ